MRKIRKSGKLVYGVGINDADYITEKKKVIGYTEEGKPIRKLLWFCPFYLKWKNMIQRCYSEKSYRTYKECVCVPEWHYFMTFRAWMEKQDWEGKHLDKDLLCPHNKIYGPDTCLFVDLKVNSFLTESAASRGEFSIGVSYSKRDRKFIARCWDFEENKQKALGNFNDPQEAHQAWLSFKLSQAHILAAEQSDPRVAVALIDRYENYHIYFPQAC